MKRGYAWSLAASVCSIIGALLTTPVLLSALGPAEYGLYLLVLSFTSYAGFLDLGLTWAATRYFAQDIAQRRSLDLAARFRTLSRFLLAVAALAGLAFVLVCPSIMSAAGVTDAARIRSAMLLSTAAFALALQGQLRSSLLRAAQRFDAAERPTFLGALLTPTLAYTCVRVYPALLPLLAINAAVNALILSRLAAAARPLLPRGAAGWQSSRLREMLSFGGWCTVSRVLSLVMMQIDRLVVALIGSVAGLPYYAIPAALANRLAAITAPASTQFYARASMLAAAAHREELSLQTLCAARLVLAAALVPTCPLLLLGPAFLNAWLGPTMAEEGAMPLRLLVFGYATSAATTIHAVMIEASGRADLVAKTRLFWAAVAITAAAFLVPWLGPTGMAATVALWLAASGLTNCLHSWRIAGYTLPDAIRPPLGAAAVLSLVLTIQHRYLRSPVGLLEVLPAMAALAAITSAATLLFVLRSHDLHWLRSACASAYAVASSLARRYLYATGPTNTP